MIQLRSNQKEPIVKAIEFFKQDKPKPSLIVLPTAWGKSILTAFVAKYTQDKIIVLQPSKELLEQNYQKYVTLYGDVLTNAGIYSASFGRKDIMPVTYATIGSIKKLGAKFKELGFTKMLIDEAHLYPRNSDSMLGTGGRLLSGIPISDIGQIDRVDVQRVDKGSDRYIEIMPFGKYKGKKIADIPLSYRQWMLANFKWNVRNARLRQSIIVTI